MLPENYTLLDASLEIALMLLAAFLLGWLFCWLMKKLFGKKQVDEIQYSADADMPDLMTNTARPVKTGLSASSRERLYDPEVGIPQVDADIEIPTIKTPEVDINSPEYKAAMARPRIDIPDLDTPKVDLGGKLEAGLDAGKDALGKGVGIAAAGIGSIAAGAATLKGQIGEKIDDIDLKMPSADIPDINAPDLDLPEVELPEVDLPDVDHPDVDHPDFKAPDIDLPDAELDIDVPELDLPEVELPDIDLPSAKLDIDLPDAEIPEIDLSEVNTPNLNLSDKLDAGLETGKDALDKGADIAAAGIGSIAAGAMSLKDKAADKVDNIKETLNAPDLPKPAVSSIEKANHTTAASPSGDDLTRITGINDKAVSVLNAHGINSYADLEKLDRTTLKRYLNETNEPSLHVTEPASWPHQARLCSEHNWTKLREYQDFLSSNRPELTETAPVEEETTSNAHDNLKKVEGIGPFFERLLNEAGITTFAQLKNTDRDTLKQIIDAAGPEYHSHEPETWPYQAGLADRGEWKKLKDYIHFMTGRS